MTRQPQPSEIAWTLWAGTIGLDSPITSRVEAATAAGYQRISLSPPDVARAESAGIRAGELGRMIRDAGLGIVLDPVMNWYQGVPTGASSFAAFSMDDALRMCEALGAEAMSAMANVGPGGDTPATEFAEAYGRLCDRASDLGVRVQLEFIPMTAVPDLAAAWRIVKSADRDNGGLLFDTWHFFRGTPDFRLLGRIPGERVFAVQLSDAPADVHGTLLQDTRRRSVPGDGSFDLPRVVAVLHRIGALREVGPEVIHPALEAMPAVAAARLAGDRSRALISRTLAGTR
ncbi:sugar phosphate isomerase/epimerase [Streptomyces sp. NBC_01622]|uniref:sugar phosphate isomerase/epimerase family protein n=1 Tax=Streptomyces sp. NBC_01622 TaxID=2975903 RepID=UPI00386DBEDB|nr:sugar phosphate isomerase/epimerase [Streptomyces sp. NBC_01622]